MSRPSTAPRRLNPRRIDASRPRLEPLEPRVLLSSILVTSTADSGTGSLRLAMTAVNLPGSGIDEIDFAIPGSGVQVIATATELPEMTVPVTIDGYTQAGTRPNSSATADDAVILIELKGEPLRISGGNSTIRGLVLNPDRFTDAIDLSGPGGDRVEGDFVGLDPSGQALPGGLGGGVNITGSPGNTIGGTTPAQRNLLAESEGGQTALTIYGGGTSSGNVVEGNFIGLLADGVTAYANGNDDFGIDDEGDSNLIGGSIAGAGNVIAGQEVGIALEKASNSTVQGNVIGLDASGHAAATLTGTAPGNPSMGIFVTGAPGSLIGGLTPGARNVISGQTGYGIDISDYNNVPQYYSPGTTVQGNFIGTDLSGEAAVPNGRGNDGYAGVFLGDSGLTVGGTISGAGNVISGNHGDGIAIGGSVAFGNSVGNLIAGNSIGTDATGERALGNTADGILDGPVSGSSTPNTIGGTSSAARNVISANGQDGVEVRESTVLQGNSIGTDAIGATSLGNGRNGVLVNDNFGAQIGGASAGAGNFVEFNNGAGVAVTGGTNDAILGNSIASNTGLGIDLGGDGVTQDTPGGTNPQAGSHTGPNDLQNFPVLTGATIGASAVTVSGTLNSSIHFSYRIEFFAGAAADPSGFGQGRQYLGEFDDSTDASGNFSFTAVLPLASPLVGTVFTATATVFAEGFGDTSEFSQALQAAPANPLVVTTSADSGPGSLRAAITFANANPGADAISFAIPGAGVHTITPITALPTITDPVTIDGYTQPGAMAFDPATGTEPVLLIALSGASVGGDVSGLTIAAGDSSWSKFS